MPANKARKKLVIAHRGASGYLPEHTLEAKAMAYAMGADYLEQDVVMTRDRQLVVLHDLTLERNTDVAEKFPERYRADGCYYVIDFDLDELRQLRVSEGFRRGTGGITANYPSRFPLWQSSFRINTLAEEIELVQGLNRSTGRQVGIYPEIKAPWFHHHEDRDITRAMLETLYAYGYRSKDDPVYLQTFDYQELRRIHDELFPTLGMELKLIQLIADNSWQETFVHDAEGRLHSYDYQWMHSAAGMQQIANYADGIGAHIQMFIQPASRPGALVYSELHRFIHAAGMAIHPYTFRLESQALPGWVESFEELLQIFLLELDVDGIFTDFPDRVVSFLDNHQLR